ncbi:MAG TPA: sugar phosphate nucleotidyltransferase [Nitrospiria bacterium]|nr:sugar phosphate nucleotidyltransferase [Nitrospiria bacterium]
MLRPIPSSERCGIVLAAGEGKRLRPFVHRLRGDFLPKQYVDITGTGSLLEQTFRRAERLVPPERLFTVVSLDHLGYREAWRQLSGRPQKTVILQPANRETAPGLLLPLMHLHQRHSDAIVTVFPSDHFILGEERFMQQIDLACALVEEDPSRLVLLGLEPQRPEPEYGYILPGERTVGSSIPAARQVARFIEKPDPQTACEISLKGGLWNTMVFAFQIGVLLENVRRIDPGLYDAFQRIGKAIGTSDEMAVAEEVYRELPSINFSSGILEALSLEKPSSLQVLPVKDVFWSDWGSEARIIESLRRAMALGLIDDLQESAVGL